MTNLSFSPYISDEYLDVYKYDISEVKEMIMKGAKHKIFLFEKSKVGITGLYTVCHSSDENVTVVLL